MKASFGPRDEIKHGPVPRMYRALSLEDADGSLDKQFNRLYSADRFFVLDALDYLQGVTIYAHTHIDEAPDRVIATVETSILRGRAACHVPRLTEHYDAQVRKSAEMALHYLDIALDGNGHWSDRPTPPFGGSHYKTYSP